MGGRSSKGTTCLWTNQSNAINDAKNNCYKSINDIREVMQRLDGYDIRGKADSIRTLKNYSDQIKLSYNVALSRQQIRDKTALDMSNNLTNAINKKNAALAAFNIEYNKFLEYSKDDAAKREEVLGSINTVADLNINNNELQQTINYYNKTYYKNIKSENNVLETRNADLQYKDLYSTDNQKIVYATNDNEHLKAVNFVFLIVYYILTFVVIYFIYMWQITQVFKIAIIMFLLLYPYLMYEIQHFSHYLWITFNKPSL
jgi:ABC-type multidrug transport system fused ATPase/permease subunit